MSPNAAVNRWVWPAVAPTPLIKPDRARLIDQIIDYFGGADRRTASVASSHTLAVPRSDDSRRRP